MAKEIAIVGRPKVGLPRESFISDARREIDNI
jgi:hypothetical protein